MEPTSTTGEAPEREDRSLLVGARRVATLVAGAASPEDVFAAVAVEIGRLLEADFTLLSRYDADGATTICAQWSASGDAVPLGLRPPLGGRNLTTKVFRSGRPTRIDDYADASGAWADVARAHGCRAAVGVPITVEGRLWGVMILASRTEPLPANAEARLVGIAELAATAIANAQARLDLRGFAEEQAALRRVATLVAMAVPPEEVFAAVTEEIGHLLGSDQAGMSRYDADGSVTLVAGWRTAAVRVGARWRLGGHNVHTRVFETGRAARREPFTDWSGPAAEVGRRMGAQSFVGVPITVEGRQWGIVFVSSTRPESLPADTEARLAGFTELAATAVANAQARVELRGFADEQAALRRVATLVARAAAPQDVFAAVTEEVGRVVGADYTAMSRYDRDGAVTVLGAWNRTGAAPIVPVGGRAPIGGRNVATLVFETGRPARIDGYGDASGPVAEIAQQHGTRCSVGVPISVEGRLWGLMNILSTREEPLPADIEARLAGFTELAATAIANAESQAQLTASRARIVTAADQARRRIQRDLHDGAQQRLVSLGLGLRTAQATAPPDAELQAQLDALADEASSALDELRELAHGIHPAILAEGGLRPALRALARRCPVPVELDVRVEGRLPEPVETAAYYVVSEALTNAAKHAQAGSVQVDAAVLEASGDRMLWVGVRDDGRGGADVTAGCGLVGLSDRVEALRGTITIDSPPGAGTALHATLPLTRT